jgi:hypothetical protein
MNKRPVSVIVISCLFAVAGAIGLAKLLVEFKVQHPFQYDIVWISLVRLMAIICGVYMLRGRNWARWLTLVWLAYHVILSGFHSLPEFALHSLLFGVFAFFLLRPEAAEYFRTARTEGT